MTDGRRKVVEGVVVCEALPWVLGYRVKEHLFQGYSAIKGNF